MNKNWRNRIIAYGCALSAAAFLLYLGFVYKLPASMATLLSSAKVQMEMGLYEEARQFTAQALQQEPHNMMGLMIDAYCADRLGKDEEAKTSYRKALPLLQTKDQKAEVHLLLAAIAIRQGNPKSALEELERAEPENQELLAKIFLWKGLSQKKMGLKKESKHCFKKSLEHSEKGSETTRQAAAHLDQDQ